MDLLLPPCQHVLRRDVPGSAVQPDIVAVVHLTLHQTKRRDWLLLRQMSPQDGDLLYRRVVLP
jgi:hypothetical protein